MRAIGLAIATVWLVFGASASAVASSSDTCSAAEAAAGVCDPPAVDGTITDDEAVVHATDPGDGGDSHSNGTGDGNSELDPDCLDPDCKIRRGDFTFPSPTLDDLIGFRPTPGTDHMEPNGWFIVNLDANFYATGGSSIQSGTLIGYPASVRFTPIRWSWTYGDGSSASRSTSGTTWEAQHIAEFDRTPTSHVYREPGTYYIDLDIGYRAEYSFSGSGWVPITGMLWLPANRLVATVGGAKTVLVEDDCTSYPGGPGC